MLRSRQRSAMARSSSAGMIVPVGLAGLATMIPAGAGSSAASCSASIWKRVAGPQAISMGTICSARSTLR